MSIKKGLERYNEIVRVATLRASVQHPDHYYPYKIGWYEAELSELCLEIEDLKEQIAIEIKHNGGNTK